MSIHELRRPRLASLVLGIAIAAGIVVSAFAQQAPVDAPAASAASPSPFPAPAAPPATVQAAPASDASQTPPTPMIASAALPHDLSPWGMFLNADIVVKVVMVGLVFASFVTWTVWLAKNLEIWKASHRGRAALAVLNEARSLGEANMRLGQSSETVARLLRTAVEEVRASPHPDPDAFEGAHLLAP